MLGQKLPSKVATRYIRVEKDGGSGEHNICACKIVAVRIPVISLVGKEMTQMKRSFEDGEHRTAGERLEGHPTRQASLLRTFPQLPCSHLWAYTELSYRELISLTIFPIIASL